MKNKTPKIGDIIKTYPTSFPINPKLNGIKAQIIGIELETHFFIAKVLNKDHVFLIKEEDIESYVGEYTREDNFNVIRAKTSNIEMNFVAYENYSVKDLVVVKRDDSDFEIAKVTAVKNVKGSVEFNAEVVCKVNLDEYKKRQNRKKRKKELQNKIDMRVKEIQKIKLLEILAKEDAELAEMLEEFKQLNRENN